MQVSNGCYSRFKCVPVNPIPLGSISAHLKWINKWKTWNETTFFTCSSKCLCDEMFKVVSLTRCPVFSLNMLSCPASFEAHWRMSTVFSQRMQRKRISESLVSHAITNVWTLFPSFWTFFEMYILLFLLHFSSWRIALFPYKLFKWTVTHTWVQNLSHLMCKYLLI